MKNTKTTAHMPYHHGDLKQALIKAATVEIECGGVESISVRALARQIGVTHKAACTHFKRKDILISAVIMEGYLRLESQFASLACEGQSPQEQLVELAVQYGKFTFEEPNMFLAMIGPRLNTHGGFPELENALAKAWRYIYTPIKAGGASGVFTGNTHENAAYFWGGLQGIFSQIILKRIKLSSEKRSEFIEKCVRKLVTSLQS